MTKRDLHLLYKSETGFIPVEIEIISEISKKRKTITFDLEDLPESFFTSKGDFVACFTLPDQNYIQWLEEKVKKLMDK